MRLCSHGAGLVSEGLGFSLLRVYRARVHMGEWLGAIVRSRAYPGGADGHVFRLYVPQNTIFLDNAAL